MRFGIWLVSGTIMYIFQIYWFNAWWGNTGALIAVIFPPIAIVFPFIYLAKEGFSIFYFGIWAVGIFAGISGRKRQSTFADLARERHASFPHHGSYHSDSEAGEDFEDAEDGGDDGRVNQGLRNRNEDDSGFARHDENFEGDDVRMGADLESEHWGLVNLVRTNGCIMIANDKLRNAYGMKRMSPPKLRERLADDQIGVGSEFVASQDDYVILYDCRHGSSVIELIKIVNRIWNGAGSTASGLGTDANCLARAAKAAFPKG